LETRVFCFGVAGFFGSGFASTGGLDWLGSFEWPIGYTSGVLRLHDGSYVVPHDPTTGSDLRREPALRPRLARQRGEAA
jgi:hypothetical protein